MKRQSDKGRYKIVGALIGGVFLTAAAAWLPKLIDALIYLDIPASVAVDAGYGIFFLVAALVSYTFVTELIRARIQRRRCDEILEGSDTAKLHDRQLFHTVMTKQIQLAKRGGWPVSLLAVHVQPMKGEKKAENGISGRIRDIMMEEFEKVMRASDLVGNFTKEEYLVFLPGCSEKNMREIARRILKRIGGRRVVLDGTTYRLDCRVGTASLEAPAAEANRLMHRAFDALDRAKQKEPNSIESE